MQFLEAKERYPEGSGNWAHATAAAFSIQIQIQIGFLHTRLDEASEMTNTGV